MRKTNTDPFQLLPTDTMIALALRSGVRFGNGNPKHRIRYFISQGLLPHQTRKQINPCSTVTHGHLPAYAIDLLLLLERYKREKKPFEFIRRSLSLELLKYNTSAAVGKGVLPTSSLLTKADRKYLFPAAAPVAGVFLFILLLFFITAHNMAKNGKGRFQQLDSIRTDAWAEAQSTPAVVLGARTETEPFLFGSAYCVGTNCGELRTQPEALSNIELRGVGVNIGNAGGIGAQERGDVGVASVRGSWTSAVADTPTGEAVIPAGKTTLTVYSTAITPRSKIFATPDRPVAVGAAVSGPISFDIRLSEPAETPVSVNWWVVN